MSWLKLDDNYDIHQKLLALGTDERRWTWTRILLYTCRQSSDIVPAQISDVIKKARPQFLNDCIAINLIDTDENGTMRVHDWLLYTNASIDDKVNWYLERNPHASANEVARQVGGTRQQVLQAVRSYHHDRFGKHDETGSRGRAARPVPETTVSEGRDVSGFARDAAGAVNGAASPGRVGRVPPEEPAGRKRVKEVRTNVAPSSDAAIHYVRNVGAEDPHLAQTLKETFGLSDRMVEAVIAAAEDVAC